MRGIDDGRKHSQLAAKCFEFEVKPVRACVSAQTTHRRTSGIWQSVYAHIAKTKRSKLADSGVRCRLLGYSKEHKAYRLLEASTGAIVTSRSVTFAENKTMKPLSDSTLCVIDVLGEDDSDTKMEDTSTGVSTPRSGSPRSERFYPDPT